MGGMIRNACCSVQLNRWVYRVRVCKMNDVRAKNVDQSHESLLMFKVMVRVRFRVRVWVGFRFRVRDRVRDRVRIRLPVTTSPSCITGACLPSGFMSS